MPNFAKVIKEEIRCFGVNGDKNIRLQSYNVFLTEIGEAEDVQAIVTLSFTSYKYLSSN